MGNSSILEPHDIYLLSKARVAMERAYSPYSNFYVGAALYSIDGQIVTGSNVENASYGCTICAERAALMVANDKGLRHFEAIAIIGRGKDGPCRDVVAPCGSCRQMLFETIQLSGLELRVIMSNTEGDQIIISCIDELLPLAFGPADLNADISRYQAR